MFPVLMRSLTDALALFRAHTPATRPPPHVPRSPEPIKPKVKLPGDCWRLELLIPPGTCDTLG